MKIYVWRTPFPRFHDEMTFIAYADSEDQARKLIIDQMSKYIVDAEKCFDTHTVNRIVQVVDGIALWLGDPYSRK